MSDNIDWSKAPERATHCSPDGETWYLVESTGRVYYCSGTFVMKGDLAPWKRATTFAGAIMVPRPPPQRPFKTGGFVQQAIDDEAERINSALYVNTMRAPCNGTMGNKYHRQVTGIDGTRTTVDVYRVLHAFPTGLPEIDHAVKKLLAPGQRGAKDRITDLREAAQSIECAIKYLEQCGDE